MDYEQYPHKRVGGHEEDEAGCTGGGCAKHSHSRNCLAQGALSPECGKTLGRVLQARQVGARVRVLGE